MTVASDRQFDRFRRAKRPSETVTIVAGRSLPEGFASQEWEKHQTVGEMDLSPFEVTGLTAYGYAYKLRARVSVAERGKPLPGKRQ